MAPLFPLSSSFFNNIIIIIIIIIIISICKHSKSKADTILCRLLGFFLPNLACTTHDQQIVVRRLDAIQIHIDTI